jgi:hypothetical protein
MGSLIATILILAFLAYVVWPWIWHIATTLGLALLLYMAWPWILHSKPWEDLTSWLQQIKVQQQDASASTPSGRLYVSPQRTDDSGLHFEGLGKEAYPHPYPRPILAHVDRSRGVDVFWWKDECWFLRQRTLSIPMRRPGKAAVVLAGEAERFRGAVQEPRYRGGWVVLEK